MNKVDPQSTIINIPYSKFPRAGIFKTRVKVEYRTFELEIPIVKCKFPTFLPQSFLSAIESSKAQFYNGNVQCQLQLKNWLSSQLSGNAQTFQKVALKHLKKTKEKRARPSKIYEENIGAYAGWRRCKAGSGSAYFHNKISESLSRWGRRRRSCSNGSISFNFSAVRIKHEALRDRGATANVANRYSTPISEFRFNTSRNHGVSNLSHFISKQKLFSRPKFISESYTNFPTCRESRRYY